MIFVANTGGLVEHHPNEDNIKKSKLTRDERESIIPTTPHPTSESTKMATTKQENKEQIRKTGPIDLDTCEPWAVQEEQQVKEVVVDPTRINKKPSTTSQPFASTFKLLLSRTKKQDDTKSILSDYHEDTSMSSGPTSTYEQDDEEAENEPPMPQYKEHIKSPLLKNTDTSLYDSRLISIVEDDASKPFRQHLDVVAL